MLTVLKDLNLERIAVVYPGNKRYWLDDSIEAVPLDMVAEGMKGIFPKK